MDKYQLELRPNMPPGFIKNEQVPELPAMTNYLKDYDGKVMTKNEIDSMLNGFQEYLKKEKIPEGVDDEVRMGLFLRELDDDYVVFCHNDTISEKCEFGIFKKIEG